MKIFFIQVGGPRNRHKCLNNPGTEPLAFEVARFLCPRWHFWMQLRQTCFPTLSGTPSALVAGTEVLAPSVTCSVFAQAERSRACTSEMILYGNVIIS